MFDTYGLQPSVALVFSEEKYMRAARNSNAYARFLSLERPNAFREFFRLGNYSCCGDYDVAFFLKALLMCGRRSDMHSIKNNG